MSENNIILFSEFEDLKKENEKLRALLSDKVSERDELRFVICKNIEMKYMLELGSAEYNAFKAQVWVLRLVRKKELIQMRINRREEFILSQIEKELDEEFEKFSEKLDAEIEAMADALERSKGEMLSEDESKQLKTLYRSAVKALHPDLHPNSTDSELRLFEQAVECYKQGDLQGLKIINAMIGDAEKEYTGENVLKKLGKEKNRLETAIKIIEDEIVAIKSDYPYKFKDIVESEEKIAEKKAMFEQASKEYEREEELLTAEIEEMIAKWEN